MSVPRAAPVVTVSLLVAVTAASGAATRESATPACPRLADAKGLPQFGRVFTGDLTGDGDAERVSVVASLRAPGACGIFLLVRRERTTAAIRLPPFRPGPARESLRRGLPRITGLFRVDRTRRLDVVVQLDRAAGRAEYALYRIRQGRLLRPRIAGLRRNRLLWSRTGRHRAVFDCEPPSGSGRLSQLEAELEQGGFWDFRRETYRSRDTTFTVIGGFGVVVEAAEAAAHFAAWPLRPLATCG